MKRRSPYQLLARLIAEKAVRNGVLESSHAGRAPSSKTGDYSDVVVVTPYGNIPWNELSRISDSEMRALMLQVERSIATWLQTVDGLDESGFDRLLTLLQEQYFGPHGVSWDRPEKSAVPPSPAAPFPVPDR